MLVVVVVLLAAISAWPSVHSECIWYEGIRDSYNEVYLHGPPKPLPLNDTSLLNEMCPHIATQPGESSTSAFLIDAEMTCVCLRRCVAEPLL